MNLSKSIRWCRKGLGVRVITSSSQCARFYVVGTLDNKIVIVL